MQLTLANAEQPRAWEIHMNEREEGGRYADVFGFVLGGERGLLLASHLSDICDDVSMRDFVSAHSAL